MNPRQSTKLRSAIKKKKKKTSKGQTAVFDGNEEKSTEVGHEKKCVLTENHALPPLPPEACKSARSSKGSSLPLLTK